MSQYEQEQLECYDTEAENKVSLATRAAYFSLTLLSNCKTGLIRRIGQGELLLKAALGNLSPITSDQSCLAGVGGTLCVLDLHQGNPNSTFTTAVRLLCEGEGEVKREATASRSGRFDLSLTKHSPTNALLHPFLALPPTNAQRICIDTAICALACCVAVVLIHGILPS